MWKRFGILVSFDGTWHEVNSAASKANQVQGLMKNTFSSWSDEILRIIYPTFVRLHLEFASSVWNPPPEYDSKTLESVQRRLTLWKESYHLPYEQIQERGDFIQNYKIVHGLKKVNWCDENKAKETSREHTSFSVEWRPRGTFCLKTLQ